MESIQKHYFLEDIIVIPSTNDDIEYYHHKSHTKYEIKQRPRKITHSVINPKFICISILFLNKFLLNKVNIWNAWGNEIEIQE